MTSAFPQLFVFPVLALAASASAATVIQDFNDASVGNLSGQSGLGSGAAGTWAGSASIDVVAGDLSPDPSTNYAVLQSGTGQSVKHQGDFGTQARKSTVSLDSALTGTTVWGSFLFNMNSHADGRVGILFNQDNVAAGATPSDPRIFGIADAFEAYLVGDVGAEVSISGVGVNTTHLALFRIDVDPSVGGLDTFTMWLDPDVTNLGAGSSDSSSDWMDAGGISNFSVMSYTAGTFNGDPGGPLIDSVRLSDESDAYFQVTGVPEPSVALLAGLGVLGLSRRRR